jgi:hypothetical protein
MWGWLCMCSWVLWKAFVFSSINLCPRTVPNRSLFSDFISMKLCNCSVVCVVCVKSAVIRWLCLYCYSILNTNHVWRGSCCTRSRQWLWNVQGWVCGWWCTPGRISINCWPTKASGKLSPILECQDMWCWELSLYLGPVSLFLQIHLARLHFYCNAVFQFGVEHVLDILNLFIPSQMKAVQSPTIIIFLSTALSLGCICCNSHGAEGNSERVSVRSL